MSPPGGRLPQRLASALAFVIALLAAVAARDLPELVPFPTRFGRPLAVVTLGILVLTLAWGLGQAWRQRQVLEPLGRLIHRRRRLVSAGLAIWLFAAVHPVHLDRLTATEIYRVMTSVLAPLAGLVLTVVAARYLAAITRRPHSWPRAGIAACVAMAGAALIAIFVLERAPHIPDEIAYLFDARSFAAGRRVASPPPVPAAFPAPEWIELKPDGAYGVFPPGWSLILAAGFLAGVPWLVNPVLAGGLVLLGSRLAVRASGGTEISRAAAWLLAASPFVLFLSGSYMAHPAAMVWTVLALISYLGWVSRRALFAAVALPVAAALLFLTRPIDASALLLAIAADAMMPGADSRRRRGLFLLGAGLAVAGALTLLDNARLTGSAFEPPVTRYFDTHHHPGANRLGFGPDVGLTWDFSPPGHSPLEALWNLSLNIEQMNRHLLGWPSGSIVLALFFLLGVRKTRGERLLLLHAAATLLLYSLYWYHGVAFGPRFLSTIAPGLVIFTWRGAAEARSWLVSQGMAGEEASRRWLGAAIAFSIAAALAIYVPLKVVAEYRGLRKTDGALLRAVTAAPAPALVLVDGPLWPDYASVYFLNAPDYRGPRVVARHGSQELDQAVLDAYPGYTPVALRRRAEGGGSGQLEK